jgi:hypothetical protein
MRLHTVTRQVRVNHDIARLSSIDKLQREFAAADEESEKLKAAYDARAITATGLIPLP